MDKIRKKVADIFWPNWRNLAKYNQDEVFEKVDQICQLFEPKDKHCNQHDHFVNECIACQSIANEGIDWDRFNEPKPDERRLIDCTLERKIKDAEYHKAVEKASSELAELHRREMANVKAECQQRIERTFQEIEEHESCDNWGNPTITIGVNNLGNKEYLDWWQALKGLEGE